MNQQGAIGACMNEGASVNSKDQFSDTSDEEVATDCIVADMFASLQFGKLDDDICLGEGKSIDKFKDATGTGMGEGAGVDDASHQTNKEARCIGTLDMPDEDPDTSSDLSSKENYKGIQGLSKERYEYLARNVKRHNGHYIPFSLKKYGNFDDVSIISKHPDYHFFIQ